MWKRWLAGSARFSVPDEGVNLLNRLRKFDLYDIHMSDDGVSFSTNLGNKTAVKNLLGKRSHTITENNNVFSVLGFFHARLALVVTAIVCVIAFVVLDQFAFRLRVQGLEGEEHAAVNAYLRERGIGNFSSKRAARDEGLALDIIQAFDFIAHASITVRRSTIVVSVHRADNVAGEIPTGDILSTHDGVVAEIIIFSGTPVVSIGDVVMTGDVLVTGNRPTAIITITNGVEVVAIISSV